MSATRNAKNACARCKALGPIGAVRFPYEGPLCPTCARVLDEDAARDPAKLLTAYEAAKAASSFLEDVCLALPAHPEADKHDRLHRQLEDLRDRLKAEWEQARDAAEAEALADLEAA